MQNMERNTINTMQEFKDELPFFYYLIEFYKAKNIDIYKDADSEV